MLLEVKEIYFKENIPKHLLSTLQICKTTAATYNCNLVYYLFINNDEISLAFALFNKGNEIILPNAYQYSFIWIKNNLIDRKSRIEFNDSLKFLKTKFAKIKLKLSPDFIDIRLFNQNGFTVLPLYTFIKKVNEFEFPYNVQKNYKRALNVFSFQFNENVDLEKIWMDHYLFLSKNKIMTEKRLNTIKSWLLELEKENLLRCFSITDESLINHGSGIIIIDKDQRAANFIFCFTQNGVIKSSINAFMYIEIQKWLDINDYVNFDYLGANMGSISEFKHTLNPQLKILFLVKFDKFDFYLTKLKNILKAGLTFFIN